MMGPKVTFSPFTADPVFMRSFAAAIPGEWLHIQHRLLQDIWGAQVQFLEAIGSASLAAHWSMLQAMERSARRSV